MGDHVWQYGPLPDALGAVVHEPTLLARGQGIAVGLRCVFAHPNGLHLPLVLAARGEPADLAGGAGFGHPDSPSRLLLTATVNGKRGLVEPVATSGSGGSGRFDSRQAYWISELPNDGLLRLVVSWPQIGLPGTATDLQLRDLEDLEHRVLPLI